MYKIDRSGGGGVPKIVYIGQTPKFIFKMDPKYLNPKQLNKIKILNL